MTDVRIGVQDRFTTLSLCCLPEPLVVMSDPLDLRYDSNGRYLAPSPFQGGRCVWPGCQNPRDDSLTETHDGRTYGLPLCSQHAFEVYSIVGAAQAFRYSQNTIDRSGRSRVALQPAEGWIYYVRSGGKIKIGHTTRLKQRIRAYPPDAQVLAVHRGSKADEVALHARFQTYRAAGREWYDQGSALLDHIQQVIQEFGPPPAEINPQRLSTGRQPVAMRASNTRR